MSTSDKIEVILTLMESSSLEANAFTNIEDLSSIIPLILEHSKNWFMFLELYDITPVLPSL